MHWYYTEGYLTVKVDGEEHKFSLEELIASSSVYKERRRKVQIVFFLSLVTIVSMQYFGGGLPADQNIYFYIGYFATPLFVSGLLSFLSYLYFRYSKKEINKLDSMFKEHLSP